MFERMCERYPLEKKLLASDEKDFADALEMVTSRQGGASSYLYATAYANVVNGRKIVDAMGENILAYYGGA